MGYRSNYIRAVWVEAFRAWAWWQQLSAFVITVLTVVAWAGIANGWWPDDGGLWPPNQETVVLAGLSGSLILLSIFVWKFVVDAPAAIWSQSEQKKVSRSGSFAETRLWQKLVERGQRIRDGATLGGIRPEVQQEWQSILGEVGDFAGDDEELRLFLLGSDQDRQSLDNEHAAGEYLLKVAQRLNSV